MAFALFGDETDRSLEKWRLSSDLYKIAKKAVSDVREERYQTLKELFLEWNALK